MVALAFFDDESVRPLQKERIQCCSYPEISVFSGFSEIAVRVSPESVIHGDGWREYGGLVDVGSEKHLRVNLVDVRPLVRVPKGDCGHPLKIVSIRL